MFVPAFKAAAVSLFTRSRAVIDKYKHVKAHILWLIEKQKEKKKRQG